jgi:aminoglycoside phosphotransferase (APT) family kinase protein
MNENIPHSAFRIPHSDDTKPVRESENLDWANLELYVRPRLAEILKDDFERDAKLEVEQFSGGHSNLTYLLRYGSREFVLRRPPFGPVPPKAHDMAREYRLLAAIHPVFELAPRPFLLCEDASVIGSTFYVMERRRGLVIRKEEPQGLQSNPTLRAKMSEAMVDTLARLHAIDIDAQGLQNLGQPVGFVTRQVQGWTKRWHGSKTSDMREMEDLALWLEKRLPPEVEKHSIVHGDFKLDNVMFDAQDLSRVIAVFDWEMTALGDPLVDLGILLAYWVHICELTQEENGSLPCITNREGYFAREQIIEAYASQTGCDLTRIVFYEVFAVFKLAVVLQQIFYRYHKGQTNDPRFAGFDKRVAALAHLATRIVDRAA